MSEQAMDNAVKLVRSMLGGVEAQEEAARQAFDDASFEAWAQRRAARFARAVAGAGLECVEVDAYDTVTGTLRCGDGFVICEGEVTFEWRIGGYGLVAPDWMERVMGTFASFDEALRFVRFADDRECREQERIDRQADVEREAREERRFDRDYDI